MIVNLIGQIASGKSTFARWFVDRHHNWKHIAIDDIRRIASSITKDTQEAEKITFSMIKRRVSRDNDSILETTGTIWRMSEIWTPEVVSRGVYTIHFIDTQEKCITRARKRNKKLMAPYDYDETEAILGECSLRSKIPSNLVVDLTKVNHHASVYGDIEWYILKAKAYWQTGGTRTT